MELCEVQTHADANFVWQPSLELLEREEMEHEFAAGLLRLNLPSEVSELFITSRQYSKGFGYVGLL